MKTSPRIIFWNEVCNKWFVIRLNKKSWIWLSVLFITTCGISVKNDIEKYNILKGQNSNLRNTFKSNQHHLNDLYIAHNQIKTFTTYLKKRGKSFTTKRQMPLVLEKISKMGNKNGLLFESFTPLSEFEMGRSMELPIAIALSGRYQQIVQFLYDISSMPQVIAWDDFNIEKAASDNSGELLHMNITVKIYRAQNK